MIAPDVGGGFGYKGILLAEEVALGWLAMRRGHPVRWIEDRREQLTAGANCREHHYLVTAHATKEAPPSLFAAASARCMLENAAASISGPTKVPFVAGSPMGRPA